VTFPDRILNAVRSVGSAVVVGFDPRLADLPSGFVDRFPSDLAGTAEALKVFGCGVVDAVASLVAIVKLQAAFYELFGPEGMAALQATARYARQRGLLVILDGKRNDIGSTAEAYARAYLGPCPLGEPGEPAWAVDALTVNPYLGSDGVAPFVKAAAEEGRGVFVLVRTSNPTAGEFQDLVADGRPIYQHVAQHLAGWAEGHRDGSGYSCVGAVVGATHPEELAVLRRMLPRILFLVPGYGAQGASAADVAGAFEADGSGALINSSRGLTFAYNRPEFARYGGDWQAAIQAAVRQMADELAAHTPAGRLRQAPTG
jgi:orotidine-5'-phosphate decarboxylase